MKPLLLLTALSLAPLQVLEVRAQEPAPVLQPAAPPENALKYLQEAAKAYRPPRNEGELSAQEERALLAQNARVFPLVARALDLPLRVDGVDWITQEGGDFLSSLHPLARLLYVRSRRLAEDGDLDGATDSALLRVRLGIKLQEDGPLMMALSAYSIESGGVSALELLVPQMKAPQLKRVAAQLHGLEAERSLFAHTLRGERAMLQAALRRDFAGEPHGPGPEKQKELIEAWREAAEADDLLTRPFALTRGLDFRAPEEDEEEGQPVPEPGRGFDRAWIEKQLKLSRHSRHRSLLRRTHAQTRLALLEAWLTVLAYRQENGALPESMQVLAPRILPALPLDPFELEAPLRFKAEGKRALIYSVGPDGMDDGGQPIDGGVQFDRGGDIVRLVEPVENAPTSAKP